MNVFKKSLYYPTLFLLLFISAFCGLIYQIVWIRLAFAAFGIITPVLSVTVSIFMLGLAVGSWLGGRNIGNLKARTGLSAITFYALTEFLIGIGGIVVPHLFKIGQTLLLPAGDFNHLRYLILSAGILGISILPWCVCMGATIPFAMAFIKEFDRSNTKGFSYLYLANVIGAICGVIACTGFFIELFGFRRTLLLAAFSNFGIAMFSFALSFRHHRRFNSTGEELITQPIDELSAFKPCLIPAILFLTGFASMAMEVVWTRAFTPVLQNTIYSFAAILAIYLASSCFGTWRYRRHLAKKDVYDIFRLMAGLSYLSFLPIIFSDPRMLVESKIMNATVVLASIFPFCATLGYLTPKLIDEFSLGDPKAAGRNYAINAFGCILGPLVAGYLLLPTLGVRQSLVLLAIPFVAIFAYYFKRVWIQDHIYATLRGFFAAAFSIFSIGFSLSYEDSIFYRSAVVRRDHVATVVSFGEGMRKHLLVNGIGMTVLTPITKSMAHLPLAIRDRKPESALVICLGMGTTFRSAVSWGINVIAVELVPSVRDAFGFYFRDADAILEKPNAQIVVDDGRRFLRRTYEKFDIVTIDPSPPVESSGSSLLYSEEFYQILKARLKEDGIVAQWVYGGEKVTVQAILKAIRSEFPFVRAFRSIEGWGYHFFASSKPFDMPSAETFARRLPPQAASDFTEWSEGKEPAELYQQIIRQEIPTEGLLTPDVTFSITDDLPFNEYFMVRRLRNILNGRHRYLR